MKASTWIASFLASKETPAVFHLSGGMTTFIIDAVATLGVTPIINMRHEQAAGFAAESATRISGRSAVAMGTSGPGATNLITTIASSFFDSTPTVFITGQVNTSELRKNPKQRQNGFQELDIVSMVCGVTKYAVRIKNVDELQTIFNDAWRIASEGRPGPVLIDIPIDIQQLEMSNTDFLPKGNTFIDLGCSVQKQVDDFLQKLNISKKPLILAGGGLRSAGEIDRFRRVVKSLNIPVVTSLMGIDSLETPNPLKVGMIGSYGNRWANRALANCDLLLVLGSRLDVRQTGGSVEDFQQNKEIVRVDIDENEITGRVNVANSLKVHLREFLSTLEKSNKTYSGTFLSEIEEDRQRMPQAREQTLSTGINPSELISELSRILKETNGYLVDVGQHQMWAAQSTNMEPHQRFITSGGMGAMGFSFPAAIGASVSKPGKWVVFVGDGCAQLSINELQTISDLNLDILICVLNNQQHGMVAQFQESNLESRFIGTRIGYSTPDFVAIASAFGIEAVLVDNLSQLGEISEQIKSKAGPMLIEFSIPQEAKALPKMDYKTSILDL